MSGMVELACGLTLVLLSAAGLLASVRLVAGPGLPDRVLALDLIAAVVASTAVVHAIASGNPIYLRVVVVTTLVSFLGTLAFASSIEKGGAP